MAISVVQSGEVGAAWSTTMGSPATAGNTIFLVVTGFNAAQTSPASSNPTLGGSAVTGTTKILERLDGGVTGSVRDYFAIWMLPNVPGGSSTVAATMVNSQAIFNVGLMYYEVSGLGASPVVDQSTSAGSNGTPGTAVNAGTTGAITAAPELILGVGVEDQSAPSGSPGYTSQATGGDTNSWAGYQIATSSGGTYTWTQTAGAAATWTSGVVTVEPSSQTITYYQMRRVGH